MGEVKERAWVTPERFRLIEEVFHGALEVPNGERTRYLDGACEGDEDLRRRVDALLGQHDPTSAFLEPPASHPAPSPAAVVGRMVGRYRIVRLIASGGMGAVYEAEQERPLRRVALKVMRAGLASEKARRRFEFESQVLASLRHPGIAQVYEAGVHEDLGGPAPFFAMELVNGASITEHCRSREASQESRVRLVVRVCEAVQHAHQRGVIHRDIKPSNILVETVGEEAGAATDVPKVIDFGIARVVAGETPAHTLGTEAGGVLGTLAYMSPEQCSHAGRAVDTRSDVYSLGVVLYELLCGALPYDIADKPLGEAASIITSRPPTRPSTLSAGVKGDLETVLLKALEKEPERRYQSAGELARDLERYLALQPIEARPPTALYQLRMFARRHRALVGATVGTALVLIAATAVSVTFALVAHRQTKRAELGEQRAHRRADFLQGALASANPWFPPSFSDEDVSDYEPWDEWQQARWPYATAPGRAASITDIVWNAAQRVGEDFADDPATRARLSDTLGWTLQRLLSTEAHHPDAAAMLREGEVLLRDALATRRSMLGDDDDLTLRSMMRLAEFLDYTPGGVPEGGELYGEALRRCRAKFGPHDARTLHSLRAWVNNQSFLQRRWNEGKEELERAVGWALDPEREASAPVLITLSYYAFTCAAMGKCEEAERMARRAVDGLTALKGEGNLRTAFAQQYAAQALLHCGKYDLAEEYMTKSLAGQRRFFGEKSLEAAHRLATLSWIHLRQERWADAVKDRREALELLTGIRGPTHNDTLNMQWDLAEALWFTGKQGAEECERLAVEAHYQLAAATSPSNTRVLFMAHQLINGGFAKRDFERTLEFITQQTAHADAPGLDPWWPVAFRRLRAQCLAYMGRLEEARAQLNDAIELGRSRGVGAETMRELAELQASLEKGDMPAPPSLAPEPVEPGSGDAAKE